MDSTSAKILAVIAALLLVADTAGVAFLLAGRSPVSPAQVAVVTPPPTALPTEPPMLAATSAADLSALAAIVDTLQQRVDVLENKKATTGAPAASAGTAKESLLYLGSGNTFNRDWTTIDSAAVTVDSAQYGQITEVRFEAALSIVSGEVYARLSEKGTSAVFYESLLTHNKSSSEWKTSPALRLPSGKHTYVVQLRSSNGEKANLDGARLRILAR